MNNSYRDVAGMLRELRPIQPVYCIYPRRYRKSTADFVKGFPGRVLYAVKANDHPSVIRLLYDSGVRHFDCASLPEVRRVADLFPDATCYFMVPVRLRGAAAEAQQKYGVRHFVIDHVDGIASLAAEIDMPNSVVFARMAVHHESAIMNLSAKFGAPPETIPSLIEAILATGAEPALAFNVGSSVTRPEAYSYAIGVASEVMRQLPVKLRLVDIGGGFAMPYPEFPVPPIGEYLAAVREAMKELPLRPGGEILCEPGRALAAPGLTAVVEVLMRKEGDRLFINDGMYGIFWELRCGGHESFPARVFRDGTLLSGNERSFRLYGPTCDSIDILPGAVELPAEIRAGDYIEFSGIGAYSLSGRTDFNGHYSDNIVTIESD
ncbi:MAG: type III PLP-dependent enzyme [Gammaproteobacteria bacterium]|nr:type III PLP-dependent enzyme [Gammaproteobacteria bacterium]MDH4316058.1 type III PLP-dependent enzyme [Gammaproteobacteria bacterium]MDH5213916.1 type III PLP-dependent enzyme [Gammaproteobacteria bacterium]